MHIRRFSSDRQFIRKTPSGSPRLRSREWRSVNRHFLIRQLSYGSQGNNSLHECVAFKNHLFAHSGRPELLEGFTCSRRKILPRRHWPEELHKSKPTDNLKPAGCQVKCQRGSPVLRYDECRRDSSVSDERIEVPNMIGKAILDVWFSRLAEPDEIRCYAMGHRCNQRNDFPPYVRRGRVPVQKKRDRCLRVPRFTVGHGGTQNTHLGQYNIIRNFHFCSPSSLNEITFMLRMLNGCRATAEYSRRYPRRTYCKDHAIRIRYAASRVRCRGSGRGETQAAAQCRIRRSPRRRFACSSTR